MYLTPKALQCRIVECIVFDPAAIFSQCRCCHYLQQIVSAKVPKCMPTTSCTVLCHSAIAVFPFRLSCRRTWSDSLANSKGHSVAKSKGSVETIFLKEHAKQKKDQKSPKSPRRTTKVTKGQRSGGPKSVTETQSSRDHDSAPALVHIIPCFPTYYLGP